MAYLHCTKYHTPIRLFIYLFLYIRLLEGYQIWIIEAGFLCLFGKMIQFGAREQKREICLAGWRKVKIETTQAENWPE